jgi:hypothetical protein
MDLEKPSKFSAEQRLKFSEQKKGVPRSEETKDKIRQSKLGIPRKPETIQKMRDANLGTKRSPEVRAIMSEAQRVRHAKAREAIRVQNEVSRTAEEADKGSM